MIWGWLEREQQNDAPQIDFVLESRHGDLGGLVEEAFMGGRSQVDREMSSFLLGNDFSACLGTTIEEVYS